MAKYKWNLKAIAIIFLAIIIAIPAAAVLLNRCKQVSVSNHGTIRCIGVEVYADALLTETLEFIEWGKFDPGQNENTSAYVKNTGNDLQQLTMWTQDFNPANASDWLNLTWDYSNSWIPVNGSIPVVFTLHVGLNATLGANFHFMIWVKGIH